MTAHNVYITIGYQYMTFFNTTLNRINQIIQTNFLKKEIVPEVLDNYIHILHTTPADVSWKRSGNFIVAKISVDNHEFFTQAESASEFIEMFTDGMMAHFDIPLEYQIALGKRGAFTFPPEALANLNDIGVKRSKFRITTEGKALMHA